MKVFLTLLLLSVCSFTLGGVFISQADFGSQLEKFFGKKGHYSFVWTDGETGLEQNEDGVIQVDGISKLKLDVDMGQVTISPQLEDKKTLEYKVKFKGEESPLNFKREDDLLEISLEYKSKKKINDNTVEVEIFLPRFERPIDFVADIKIGSLKLMPGLYFDDFNVDMSAGEMKAEALSFSRGEIELSAGELNLKSTDLKMAELSVSGGSLSLEVINPSPDIKAEVKAGQLRFGTAEGVEKNFRLEAEVSIGEVDLVEGYEKSGDDYVYGEGKGKVELEVDLGEVEVF
jgi:hypothetical protein